MLLSNNLFSFRFLNIFINFEIIYSATIPVAKNTPSANVSDIGCNILVMLYLENSDIVTVISIANTTKSINAIIINTASNPCSTFDYKLFSPNIFIIFPPFVVVSIYYLFLFVNTFLLFFDICQM